MSNRELWWLNPIKIYLLLVSIIVIYAYITPESSYKMLYDIAKKNIDEDMMLLYVINSFFFILGCLSVKKNTRVYVQPNQNEMGNIVRVFVVLYSLTMLAYFVWYTNFIMNFGLSAFGTILNGSLSDNIYKYRDNSGRVSGLTTMTELGVGAAPLGIWLYQKTKKNKYIISIFILVILAIIRSFLFTERLATIELAIPMFVVALSFSKQRKIYSMLPLLGVGTLYVMFGLFEYSRSWLLYYKDHYNGTFPQFVLDRLIGYYTTAINTECAWIKHHNPSFYPQNLFHWARKLPIVGEYWKESGGDGWYEKLLIQYGSPEFNNPGGLLIGCKDFGLYGVLVTYLFGYIFMKFYYKYKDGSLAGLVLFSVCFLAILEFTRFPFFSDYRSFYCIISLIVIYSYLRKYKAY